MTSHRMPFANLPHELGSRSAWPTDAINFVAQLSSSRLVFLPGKVHTQIVAPTCDHGCNLDPHCDAQNIWSPPAISGVMAHGKGGSEVMQVQPSPTSLSIPVFIGHGTMDQLIPSNMANNSEQTLQRLGTSRIATSCVSTMKTPTQMGCSKSCAKQFQPDLSG